VAHKFVVAPEVMDQETWLARRGQPLQLPRPQDVCPDAPVTLDSKPSDEPDPTKLN
jgi:hypothetical protein